ncbi:MAG TPA: substrate-binding domain-containing protein [Geminicoccaceae bacterium]|nr:substrate-binding domain-containing protein [Geminicoccus sp.]HMU52893.1 substrate-binding domain-containing protein [Geminicoccaceae bacterium]
MTRRIVVAATLGLGLLAGAASAADKYTIGYSQFWGTNPFLVTMANGARKAIAEWKEKGVEIDMILTNGGDTDTTRQVADLEDLYAQGIDGLVLFPGDSIVVAEPVKNIYNKDGIPVVITDIGLQSGSWDTFIITDNYAGGESAADLMAKHVPAGAKVITFDHAPGNDNAQNRQRGFEDQAKKLGLDVQPEKFLKLSLEEGRRLMEDTLVAIPDIKGVYFFNQVVAQGAAAALAAANRTDVQLVSFDLDPVSYQLVKDGKILGLVVQDPFKMGYEGINAMVTKLQGGKPVERMDIPTRILTKENAAEFAQDPQITGG